MVQISETREVWVYLHVTHEVMTCKIYLEFSESDKLFSTIKFKLVRYPEAILHHMIAENMASQLSENVITQVVMVRKKGLFSA